MDFLFDDTVNHYKIIYMIEYRFLPTGGFYLNKFVSRITYMQGIDDKVIVEIFLEGGSEFTAIVLDVGSGSDCEPIVLLPTEVYAFWFFK